jgi:hypothetical protein
MVCCENNKPINTPYERNAEYFMSKQAVNIATTRPSDHLMSAKLLPTVAARGCHVISVTGVYGRNLGFLDRSRYFFF